MLKFYYNPRYKYTNREIIDVSSDNNYTEKNYVNIDSPDTINGHIIYRLTTAETIPTYIVDTGNGRRWFVSGITQLNSSKFQISLLRDIISETPMNWKNEEAYISSGVATDYNKYKRWELPFTNTKIRQERLNFGGKSSFFVFYVNEQHYNSGTIIESDLEITGAYTGALSNADYTISNIGDIPSSQFLTGTPAYAYNLSSPNFGGSLTVYPVRFKDNGQQYVIYASYNEVSQRYEASASATSIWGFPASLNYLDLSNCCTVEQFNNNVNSCASYMALYLVGAGRSHIEAIYTSRIYSSNITALEPYINKIIYNSTDQKYYTINLNNYRLYRTNQLLNATESTNLFNNIKNNVSYPQGGSPSVNGSVSQLFSDSINVDSYTYNYVEYLNQVSFNFKFIANNRKLPKSAVRCVNIVSDDNFTDDDIAQCLMLARANPMLLDANPDIGRIIDIQYLPFSLATATTSNFQITPHGGSATNLTAKFLNDDDYTFFNNLTDLTDINKEADTIKIVSPSRASQYLFRPYDNDGNMEFTTKVTLRPYNSTIYVRPSTNGLLMYDWDDKDCLIIEEDFSLTQVNSEWANYVYNNRNYQNAFNRQIQGREFERKWERKVEEAQMKSDEWTARNISAQKAQTYTGNIPIISGIAGAIGTAWKDEGYMQAAQMDRAYNEALYQEGINLARDNFQYQIENIQSQPLIPSKVTTIDVKFLDGIYLEYYSTNETEKFAIEGFYKYNGNRIDTYSTFASYWGWFVRGKIIKSEHYTQPEIDELNRRLSMGIFTEVQYGN